MSEQDLTPDQLEQLREQLASVSAGDVVAEAALSLIALAYVRLGIPPEQHERFRDLDAARLLVDALGGMLAATEGRLGAPEPSLRDALATLHDLRRRGRPRRGPPRRLPVAGGHPRPRRRRPPAPPQRPLGPRPGLTQKAPPLGRGPANLRDAGRQRTEGPSCSCSLRKRPHVRGLRALGAVGDLELDGLALVEGLVAVALDGREVDEDVVAAVAGDEAVALLVAEPLDGAFRQRAFPPV